MEKALDTTTTEEDHRDGEAGEDRHQDIHRILRRDSGAAEDREGADIHRNCCCHKAVEDTSFLVEEEVLDGILVVVGHRTCHETGRHSQVAVVLDTMTNTSLRNRAVEDRRGSRRRPWLVLCPNTDPNRVAVAAAAKVVGHCLIPWGRVAEVAVARDLLQLPSLVSLSSQLFEFSSSRRSWPNSWSFDSSLLLSLLLHLVF